MHDFDFKMWGLGKLSTTNMQIEKGWILVLVEYQHFKILI